MVLTKVPGTLIADDTITSAKIADGTIISADIADATIVAADIANTTITSGNMALDPRDADNLSSGSVPLAQLGNVTEFSDVKILNDIATLALHSAIQNNQAAYNLANAFVDQFEDSTGIDVLTDCVVAGEYVSTLITVAGNDSYTVLLLHMDGSDDGTTFTDSSASPHTATVDTAVTKTAIKKFGTASGYFNGSSSVQFPDSADWDAGSGSFTLDMWLYNSDKTGRIVNWVAGGVFGLYARPGGQAWAQGYSTGWDIGNFADYDDDTWSHVAWDYDSAANLVTCYQDGVIMETDATTGSQTDVAAAWRVGRSETNTQGYTGYVDELRLSKGISRYGGSAFTPEAGAYGTTTAFATGNYTSTTETANATVSKMSIVVLYKNAYGTATLDTDLVAQVSSNGGTNYTSAPLTAAGTFSTGILMAKSNDITISNTGTAPKYKISFANQVSTSKETQVHGVAILY